MTRYSPKTLRELCEVGILMNHKGSPGTQLRTVVELLNAKHVHTPHQLSEKIGLNKNLIAQFIKGHVYHGNDPAHVLTFTAQHVAKFLFPDIPKPANKLERILKGKETCDIKPPGSETQAVTTPTNGKYEALRVGAGATIGYQPQPGRPYLAAGKDGKWELLIAPKTS